MSTMKHTPGPWFVEPEPVGGLSIWDGNDMKIAEAVIGSTCGDMPPAEQEANARLIAEAPALLAALRNLTAWVGVVTDNTTAIPVVAAARTAIQRATGEA